MVQRSSGAGSADERRGEPAVIVSCDSHAGPRLTEQLREYCPKAYLRRFDAFVDSHRAAQITETGIAGEAVGSKPFAQADHPNMSIPGHHDMTERLRDMNYDGVAAEVIFHFSQNGEPLPFVSGPAGGLGVVPSEELDLAAVGYHIYNRWLADFVSLEPERHVGLAYLPTWDIAAAAKEAAWAREAGLRAVNFPPPSRVGHLEYNNPAWEPFWSVCEDLDMALTTHSGGAAPFDYFSGPGARDLLVYECGGWLARRAVWWLIHGQVFEHHPRLKLVITEQYEGWWSATLNELDAVHRRFGGDELPKAPSEYARSNVFLGASFLSPYGAEQAYREGYTANVMWGRDYPHVEGTFLNSDDPDLEPISILSLRQALSRVPTVEASLMAGANAVKVYGLDSAKLTEVALRIGAPTIEELVTPPDSLPDVPVTSNAFRGQAGTRPFDVVLS